MLQNQASLDAFTSQHQSEDVKISIDGKRIATGFGKMGEEDLGGFEAKPTLQLSQLSKLGSDEREQRASIHSNIRHCS